VKITLEVLVGITNHARRSAPLECCGLLVGSEDWIDEHIATRNIRNSAVAYQVDPVEHIAAMKAARARGRRILGAYHSHPSTEAVPSATDVAEAYYGDGFVYFIVSLSSEPPDIRAYRLADARLEAVTFEVVR
jgi:[CysO sulfur-carrier protein]-S-L-cysteine hydrolase